MSRKTSRKVSFIGSHNNDLWVEALEKKNSKLPTWEVRRMLKASADYEQQSTKPGCFHCGNYHRMSEADCGAKRARLAK